MFVTSPTMKISAQCGVPVVAEQEGDERRDQQRVAELDGADEPEPVGDPAAEQRPDHAAAELERQRGSPERAGRAEVLDPVERDERVDAEGDRGAGDLDGDQQREHPRAVDAFAVAGGHGPGGQPA